MALAYSRSALKGLQAMPLRERRRMIERLESVAAEPTGRHPGVLAMQGEPGGRFRVRQGDWRAVFVVEGRDIFVLEVAHRREVYR